MRQTLRFHNYYPFTMLKTISHICKRLYHHDSSFRQRAPVVKLANSRISKTVRQRRDAESSPRVRSQDPTKNYEPFPFAITEENKSEVLKRVVSPLSDTPYEEQLNLKETYCKNALRHFAQELYKSGTPIRLDVRRLPCTVKPIVRSPEIYNYRNKDEFSIWRGHDGETNTVGHMIFSIGKHGDTVCVEPNGCDLMKPESMKVVDVLQDFIRHQAQLPVSYSLGTDGGWRRFVVMNNNEGHVMLVGVVNPRTLTVQQILEERNNFKNFLVNQSREKGFDLKSLYVQLCPHNRCSHRDAPYELLHGDKTLTEIINGLKISISPETYRHPNTSGAEVLYNTITQTIEECFEFQKSGVKPIFIDTNCGPGILALHLSPLASTVIGIDDSNLAIDNARTNAEYNGCKNSEFICSNVEIVLERILEKYNNRRDKDIVVVCNVSKLGLKPNVAQVLRDCRNVTKIVYVASRVDAVRVIEDLFTLCNKRHVRASLPFAPILAAPVDICPHLSDCTTIVVLER